MSLFGIGCLLNLYNQALGTTLCNTSLFLLLPIMAFLSLSQLPGRIIVAEKVTFKPDVIQIGSRTVDLQAVKAIDAVLEYKGGYRSAKSIADGTGNRLRLIYQDSSEEEIRFYIAHVQHLQTLQAILAEAKSLHHLTLIL